MANGYFDFHFHPMFKQYISNYEAQYPSARPVDNLLNNVAVNNDIMNYIDKKMLHFLDSQCSFLEMSQGNEALGVANIVTLEYAIATANNILGYILKTPITDPLDKNYFRLISDSGISYYQLMLKELNLYTRLANTGSMAVPGSNGRITLLTRKHPVVDLDSLEGAGQPTLVLSLEGGHNLLRTKVNQEATAASNDVPADGAFDAMYNDFLAGKNDLVSPADSLRRLFTAMWQEDLDLLYLTLTHLTFISEKQLATHAYGMKLLKHPYFYPHGSGITPDGFEMIKAAYGMSPDGGATLTPILIDLKHMSLKSRLDFYAFYDSLAVKPPIIATHMGVTGYSILHWTDAPTGGYRDDFINGDGVYQVARKPRLAGIDMHDPLKPCRYQFNPWTINLMDEDIVCILNSDGMIGMSLDARIIGVTATFTNLNYDPTEYLSQEEYNYLVLSGTPIMDASPELPPPAEDIYQSFDMGNSVDSGDPELIQDPDREVACLAFNILHIIAVAKSKTGVDAWSHIAMGSDYDGLIEPLAVAYNCGNINVVESKLCDLIMKAEATYLYHNPIPDHFGPLLPRTPAGDVDTDGVASRIRDIMYTNGKNFIKKWYRPLQKADGVISIT